MVREEKGSSACALPTSKGLALSVAGGKAGGAVSVKVA